ncbi:hypothetical protein [Nocardioides kribbensis]|uniref:Uncharacterized protein n=1 Tax=Nocardioides kribbensis TaxID=305517 RepID=A0ABV1NYY7_9ACTN
MNPQEAAALLGVAASFDNRKPDPDAATAWSVALRDVRFVDARDAVVAHYSRTSDWLMPAHVIHGVKAIRRNRLLEHPPITPPDLEEAETRAWMRAMTQRIADGEVIDPEAARGELKPRNLGELRSLMARPDEDGAA